MMRVSPDDATHRACAVKIDGLHKSFGQLEVLKGISLEAREGDVVTLIGSSGSGKSTLLRCINLLEVPNAGTLSVGAEEIQFTPSRGGRPPRLNPHKVRGIRMRLGMVFQSFNLWNHMTVLENIIEAPLFVHGVARAEAVEFAEQLLAKVGLYEKRDVYPAFLSGGQQQRAAIARALAINPRVMLFDEPTSALDPELVGEVLKVIRDLADEGRTMILVTHEMSFARQVSSHVAFLHKGIVEEEGPPAKVFHNPQSERCRQFVSAQHALA
ncbi:ABC transporter ATP-binding protein [Microvirga sp.]|uniref:ABC transporter ATP-binding protein n=1 Tax=Microvirga sp. TaxID=1873136 RepID=UPI002484B56F|nr:ATP-binding cassette domain-containing protein [Microvirga sp.]